MSSRSATSTPLSTAPSASDTGSMPAHTSLGGPSSFSTAARPAARTGKSGRHSNLPSGYVAEGDSLPFLEKGILQILSNATDGLSIVLEHRYYGDSLPVESFSTDDLRFLNNDEAMEDSAHVSCRLVNDSTPADALL